MPFMFNDYFETLIDIRHVQRLLKQFTGLLEISFQRILEENDSEEIVQ